MITKLSYGTLMMSFQVTYLHNTIDFSQDLYYGYHTASVNCCKRTFYCNNSKTAEFEMIDTKNSSTAYVVMYKLIT